MLKITLSFANLSAQDAETLANTHACENGFVDGFQDFVAWFDDSTDLECWSQALIQDAHNLGATMVAEIIDEVKKMNAGVNIGMVPSVPIMNVLDLNLVV